MIDQERPTGDGLSFRINQENPRGNGLSIFSSTTSFCKDLDTFVEDAADRPSKDRAYLMDASLARQELGWRAKIGLHDGIKKTADWVKSHLDEIKTLPLDYVHRA